ncbi:unnamed protein product [Rodentolepis nana]|uniref:ABC transporter ATP-binding protein n=1 Tax=Rodentolepis nana TaxID=102285 RepID=A0A0R3TUZ8_RODNA|nr:unnamed protein product [Rodentolepis nana]
MVTQILTGMILLTQIFFGNEFIQRFISHLASQLYSYLINLRLLAIKLSLIILLSLTSFLFKNKGF